jgi:hypothetical protein
VAQTAASRPDARCLLGSLTGMVAWTALAVSLISTGVLVWERFLRRSRFEVQADWIISASAPVLRVAIYNVGYRKDTVRDVRFKEPAMPAGRGWTPFGAVMSQLPVVLDVDEASPAFMVQPQHEPWDIFDDALLCSRIDMLEVENARGRVSTHALPALCDAERNTQTNSGSTIPKSTP